MKKIIFFLLATSQVFCQQINFKGTLLDKETKEPIVYANISFLDSDKGISSKENGKFDLIIDKKFLTSKIHISCLNYKDTIVLANDLYKKTVFLTPTIQVLDEIVLKKRVEKSVVLDEVTKKVEAIHSDGMRMIAKYFPNSKKNKCCAYVSEVAIHFSEKHSTQSKFRVRIFDKNPTTGLPENDLLNENLPMVLKPGDLKLTINLEDYNIEMPKNGLFIAFEKLFIPFNEYGENDNNKNSNSYYSPVIGFTKYPKKKNNAIYLYVKGEWREVAFTKVKYFSKYAPAISLTLTN
ncbi:carboxypeptidase-like regulatory domain-containing protein [Polaribacter sp.]|nr:carboxypeptidase-like regulatory domain-containing protein [Polaribacter sp.]